jgi:DNA (cytosine-5)-methyltransferase 1
MAKLKKQPTFLDLFSGCGGFSYGLEKAGFECLAGIDFNPHAVETFKLNHHKNTVSLVQDMTSFSPVELEKLIKKTSVDVIIGGPPCQGFSTARQSSGSNSGQRLVADPRRELYKDFLKFVAHFKPKVFVMENVLGIKKAQNGIYFTAIQNEARKIGYRVSAVTVNAWEYGVPQKRIRQLFIGTLSDLPIFVPDIFIKRTHSENPTDSLKQLITLGEAIEDLPSLKAGDERIIQNYDDSLRKKYLKKYSGIYLKDVLEIEHSEKLLWHVARPHNDRDLRDFARLMEGETCSRALARGVEMEFPYNRGTFKDRYTKQSRSGLCSTIVAHLRADGLMFIHPTQPRSLTPREAARIQTFPDTFKFAGSRSHIFTQIGNAVPPQVGKAVGLGILSYFEQCLKAPLKPKRQLENASLVKSIENFVIRFGENGIESILEVTDKDFLDIWEKIHLLHPHLHPDSVLDNGTEISKIPNRNVSFCVEPFFIRSGWPVDLAPIAMEANRRYKLARLSSNDYFHLS